MTSTTTAALINNIQYTKGLIKTGQGPEVIGTVCGSESGQVFWQRIMDRAGEAFSARLANSFQEDLPVGQAFGMLYLWHQLKELGEDKSSSLIAFVFGSGTRSTPFTEHDCGQKPAIKTFAREGDRFISMVELAVEYFIGVEGHLRRSGFKGLVVKWGDEVQIPTVDLSATNNLFQDADVVRFVSMQKLTPDTAKSKDWVGVDESGFITQFIPRRDISEMEALADRGLLTRSSSGELSGGVNLGSIGVSHDLLNALLDEFKDEVFDDGAKYADRPALDPEFFTALTIAAISSADERDMEWERVVAESSAMQKLVANVGDVKDRLIATLVALESERGRRLKMVAMDFEDQYWGDIGQHHKIYDFYMGLNDTGSDGEIARALAGVQDAVRDEQGNIVVNSTVGSDVNVSNSVLINVDVRSGEVSDSVLLGTRASRISATRGFDVLSTVTDLTLQERAGSYRVASAEPVMVDKGQRVTTVYLPGAGPEIFKVHENTDLRDKAITYDVPIEGNATSFKDAHAAMAGLSVTDLVKVRTENEAEVFNQF